MCVFVLGIRCRRAAAGTGRGGMLGVMFPNVMPRVTKLSAYARLSSRSPFDSPTDANQGLEVFYLTTAGLIVNMIDPLPYPLTLIQSSTQPIADLLSLKTLPLHAHEVFLSFTAYYLMDVFLAPRLSTKFFAKTYSSLPTRTKINWNIRVVSTIQAIFICGLAFWTIVTDEERKNMNLEERIWGYTGAVGMTQAFAAGYFMWDVKISAVNVGILGWGSLAHAVSALLITSLGFVSLSIPENDSCGGTQS